MKIIKIIFPTLVLILLLIGAKYIYGLNHQDSGDTEEKQHDDVSFSFEVSKPAKKDFSEEIQWFGKVKSLHKVNILSTVSATVEEIHAEDGTIITKGSDLFTLNDPQIENQVKSISLIINSIKNKISLNNKILKQSREGFEEKLITLEQLTSIEEKIIDLHYKEKSLFLEIEFLKKMLVVKATKSGLFTNRQVSVGQFVTKNSTLAEIVSLKDLYIEASTFIQPSAKGLLNKEVIFDLKTNTNTSATITSLVPQATNSGATVFWITGQNLSNSLTLSQSISGKVILSKSIDKLAVPKKAIVFDDEENAYVFVKKNSEYIKKAVNTGSIKNGWIEITRGVSENDEIVIDGAYQLSSKSFTENFAEDD